MAPPLDDASPSAPAGGEAASSPSGDASGVLGLMRAVLIDAIDCIAGRGVKPIHRAKVAMQARAWVARHGRESVFAFDSICDVLELDGERLRRRLLTRGSSPFPRAETPATRHQRRDETEQVA